MITASRQRKRLAAKRAAVSQNVGNYIFSIFTENLVFTRKHSKGFAKQPNSAIEIFVKIYNSCKTPFCKNEIQQIRFVKHVFGKILAKLLQNMLTVFANVLQKHQIITV